MKKTGFLVFGFILVLSMFAGAEYDIGAYYLYYSPGNPANPDHYEYDWAMMDLARNGGTKLFVSGNSLYDNTFWAIVRNWGMKGATAYNILNGFPGDNPTIDDNTISQDIQTTKTLMDNMSYMGQNIGDVFIGRMICDEPECIGLTVGQQNLLRRYNQLYAGLDPARKTYINHCYPTWYDLDEGHPTSSTGCTIEYNHSRITACVNEAQRLGYSTFTAVAQIGRIADWMNRDCANINYYGFGPCTLAQINWLASRTAYQDTYEEVMTPYYYGADGVMVWHYNVYTGIYAYYAMVDADGNDNGYKRQGFGDAAKAIRILQNWPSVSLFRKVSSRRSTWQPLMDRRNYPAGPLTVAVDAAAYGGASLAKVVFGMSTNGGATWTSVEDASVPYEHTFTLTAGTTAIIRAQSVDTTGRKSIWAANMIRVVNSAELTCGDYESAGIPGDLNNDCTVNLLDCRVLAEHWLACDDPGRPECGVWDEQHQFYCGQPGSGFPGIASDLNGNCDVDIEDIALLAKNWLLCDHPTDCP